MQDTTMIERVLPAPAWGVATAEGAGAGVSVLDFDDIEAFAADSASMHLTPSERAFDAGDFDLFDFDFTDCEVAVMDTADDILKSFEVIEALTAPGKAERSKQAYAGRKRRAGAGAGAGADSSAGAAVAAAAAAAAVAAVVTDTDTASRSKRSRAGAASAGAASASASAAPRGARGGGGPQRKVPWRRLGSDQNERMRAAVWLYRFAPAIKSKTIQREFKVAVKSLMRYVYDSCLPEYAAYGLYFGAAGQTVAGMADRAVPKEDGRVNAASIGYMPDYMAAGVPRLASEFLARQASSTR